MRQKIGIHSKLDGVSDGAIVPAYIKHNGEWVKVSEGKYDAKNQILDLEVETDDEEVKAFMKGLGANNIRNFSYGPEQPAAHNID